MDVQASFSDRLRETTDRLVMEFGNALPPETIQQVVDEYHKSFTDTRIADFVPLLVHRYSRERLIEVTRQIRVA
jgi:hypothetical protein